MLKPRIIQNTPLQWLVNENSGRWKAIGRTAPGQEYCWVVINGDEPKIGAAPSDDNDWSTMADHWSSSRPYRAYIPVTPNNDNFPVGSWVSDWGFNGRTGWSLTLDARKIIYRVRDNARTMSQAVLFTYKSKNIIPPSPSLSLAWLGNHFSSEESLAAMVAEARRHILDQYGFIAFSIKRDPAWRTRPALSTIIDMILNTGLTECTYRGCVVDFKKVEFEELAILVEDEVPFHYQWFPTDVGAFNPRGLKVRYYHHLSSEETSQKEDHFSIDLSNAGESIFYRVSSGGDKARITRRAFRRWAYWCTSKHEKLPSESVYLLFQDVLDADDGPDGLALIDMEDLQLSDHDPTVPDTDALSDYSSDDEGVSTELRTQETTTALSQSELDAADTFLSTLKGAMTRTAAIQEEPDDRAPQRESLRPESLRPKSLIPLEEDTTITSCSHVPSQIRENASTPCLPLPAMPCPTRIPVREMESLPRDERGMLGAPVPQALSQLAKDLQFNRPPVLLPGINFPTIATQRTGKLVTTFRTAVRIAYAMFVNPNVSPADSIPTLLRSGAPYRVLSPFGNATPRLLSGQPPYLATRHEYTGLDLKDPDYWESYKKNVKQLLHRPYARRFLSLGGILWRLALQFGPADLIERALAGPSSDATDWLSGDMLDRFCDDKVTPADKAILLGRSLRGSESCWPPYDLWDASTEWTGCWSDDNESWFQSHLSNLSDGKLDAPKSRQVWRKVFIPAPVVVSQDPAHRGTDPLARAVFGQLGHSVDREPCWDLAQCEAT